jgi:cell division protein FtsB
MKLPKKIGRWILIAGIGLVLYFSLTGDEGILNLYRSHREAGRMAREIRELNVTIDSLRETIRRLQSDTAFIEGIAREKLGMAGKNEKVYKFIEE